MINSRDIGDLRPDVAANTAEFLARCNVAGYPVLITSTMRDQEYQTMLYEQGRSKKGPIVTNAKLIGFHGYGLAFDFCRNVKGREYDDSDGFFEKVAAIGKKIGFSWGGDWKSFVDKPHMQWDEYGKITVTNLRAGVMPEKMPECRKEKGIEEMIIYRYYRDIPAWGRTTIEKLMRGGFLKGDKESELNISYEFVRVFVVLDRMGLIPKIR